MLLLLYARHALRRAWTAPVRSLSVLAASTAVWTALFGLAADGAEAHGTARRAGLINGAPAYRITLEKPLRQEVVPRRPFLPFELVELVRPLASALVVKTAAPVRIGGSGRILAADLLFYELAGTWNAAPPGSFPPCALIAAPAVPDRTGALLNVGRDWRCRLAPLPPALTVLAAARTSPAIVIPIRSMADIAGTRARERIDTVWAGIDDQALLARLVAAARARFALDLKVYSYGQRMQASVGEAASNTTLSKYASAAGLGLALGLYVHGVFGAMRRELALRTCLGHSFGRTLVWLQVDVWTQALAMSLLSGALGLALHAGYFGRGAGPDALVLLGTVNCAIVLVFSTACTFATVLVFRHERTVQLASM
jgi:hypothetical protein